MSRICAVCGKTSVLTVTRKLLRGHYNPTSKKRKYPNLQWVRLDSGKRTKICTQCMRTRNKTRVAVSRA